LHSRIYLTSFRPKRKGSKRSMRYFYSSLILLILTPAVLAAESRYITDEFEITLRTGKGNSHKIIKMLPSGAKLELIEEEEGDDGQYALVKTSDGTEGWVLKRYLSNNPSSKDMLAASRVRTQKLKESIDQLKSELDVLKRTNSGLENTEQDLNKARGKLEKELEKLRKVAADPISVNEENEKLTKELLNIKREIQTIEQENVSLRDSSARDWFLIGAGVCLGGILLGLALPNLKFRRRSTWGSL